MLQIGPMLERRKCLLNGSHYEMFLNSMQLSTFAIACIDDHWL